MSEEAQVPEGWEAKAWAAVPIELKQIAQRHGPAIYSLVMQAGICGYAGGIISQRLRNDRRGLEALSRLVGVMNGLMEQLLAAMPEQGKEAFLKCREEINIIAQLHDATQQSAPEHPGTSKGGIILNS